MKSIAFELITFDRVVRRGKATSVSVPTPQGEITILPGHIPLVSVVVPGELRVALEEPGEHLVQETLVIGAGFLEVSTRGVSLLCRTAERLEDIDLARANEAVERAQRRLKELSTEQRSADDREFAEMDATLARNLARLRVARRRRKA